MSALRESGAATVDATGRAVVTLQNLRAFEKWEVTTHTVSSTSTAETTARVYRNHESPSALLEGTYSGKQDASNTRVSVGNGESLICVWSGATAGSRCVYTIEGTKTR